MKIFVYHCPASLGRAVLVLDPETVEIPAEFMISSDDATEVSIASDMELETFTGFPAETVWSELLTKGWCILPERRANPRATAAVANYQRAGAGFKGN